MFDLCIENGIMVTGDKEIKSTVYIKDEKIAAITEGPLSEGAKRTINAAGKYLFPGFIDPHVHSRDGGATYKEDFYHSTRAAAKGGITTILEMPNAVPAVINREAFQKQKDNLESKAYIDFGMWGLCLGRTNNHELKELRDSGVIGFKFFWGYAINKSNYNLVYNYDKKDTSVIPPLSDGEIYTIFEEMAKIRKPLAIHAENAGLISELTERLNTADYENEYEALLAARPSVAEETIVKTAISFAGDTGARLHILHMSAGESVRLLREAKKEGLAVTGETAPHYLFLTNKDYKKIGNQMKGYPPVRYQEDQDALWQGLVDGTIDSMGSDHAPHTEEEKKGSLFQIPAGMCAVETMVPLMLHGVSQGRITKTRLAKVLSENTAKLYGIYPEKGSLEIGTDADITIVDFTKEHTIRKNELYSISKVTAFDGFQTKGLPAATIVRGRVVMENGELTCEESKGRFIKA